MAISYKDSGVLETRQFFPGDDEHLIQTSDTGMQCAAAR